MPKELKETKNKELKEIVEQCHIKQRISIKRYKKESKRNSEVESTITEIKNFTKEESF